MKKKTNKLSKLERNRKSILTDDMEHCYLCGSEFVDIHEIYSGANRKQSMANNFCIPLCRTHHESVQFSSELNTKIKQLCQMKFEREHTREEFLAIIGKNYL